MREISKERFEYFIQQALAEYELLHVQVAEQAKSDLPKRLSLLHRPSKNSTSTTLQSGHPQQIPEYKMHKELLMPQAMLPGTLEDDQLMMLETGQLMEIEVDSCKDLQPHPVEVAWTSDFDSGKSFHDYTLAGASTTAGERVQDSLTLFSVLPGSVENSSELPSSKIGLDRMLDLEMTSSNMDIQRGLDRHLTAGTSISSVNGSVDICLGDTPGALQNPHQVKETLVRMSEEHDTDKVSFTSGMSRLVGKASYKEHGLMASIARSRTFEGVTMLLVILNGIWIAIDADYNRADSLLDAGPLFQVAEHLFCSAFTAEIMIRFVAFSKKRDALFDPWFVFDASLVLLLIVETWIIPAVAAISDGKGVGINMSILRLLRVARLSRLARVVRAVPELCFMVKGVLQGTRAVACTLGLLLGVLYVFGIALRQLSDETKMGNKYFGTVPHAVFTLFVQGALLDEVSVLFIEVYEESQLCAILLFMFVVVAALTLMSMLVGVLCQVMNEVAIQEKERMAFAYVKEQMLIALKELDTNMDQLISKEEFVHMISNEKAKHALKNVGVDVVHLVDYADYYFQSDRHGESFDEKWPFDRFIEEVMLVRGVNAATVRDAVELRKFVHAQNTSQNVMLKHVQENQTILARNQVKLEHLILRGNFKASQSIQ